MAGGRGKRAPAKPLLDEKVDFITFVKLYNVFLSSLRKDWRPETPRHHLQIARWLVENRDQPQKLLFCYRSAAKSYMLAIWVAWCLYDDPTSTHIMLSATDKLASKNANNVREVIKNHPLCAHLVPPNESEMWRKTMFNVVRPAGVNEYSMMALSLQGDVTGHRCQHLYGDDLETKRNTETQESRDRTKEMRQELRPIATKTITYAGTPHASREDSMYTPMLTDADKFVPLIIPIYTENKETGERVYAWPELFCAEKCAEIVGAVSAKTWLSQYLLELVSISDAGLPIEFVHRYSDEIISDTTQNWHGVSNSSARIGDKQLVKLFGVMEPSTALPGRDDSAFLIMAEDQDKNVYLHRAIALPPTHAQTGWRPQTDRVVTEMKALGVFHVVVETNLSKTLPSDLKQSAERLGHQITVIPVHTNTTSKKVRIAEALEGIMGGGKVWAHTSTETSPFASQCTDFPANVGRKGSKDDFIDAAALGVEHMPKVGRYRGSSGSGQLVVRDYRLNGR